MLTRHYEWIHEKGTGEGKIGFAAPKGIFEERGTVAKEEVIAVEERSWRPCRTAMFRVELDNGQHGCWRHISAKCECISSRCLPGDKVSVELSPTT